MVRVWVVWVPLNLACEAKVLATVLLNLWNVCAKSGWLASEPDCRTLGSLECREMAEIQIYLMVAGPEMVFNAMVLGPV